MAVTKKGAKGEAAPQKQVDKEEQPQATEASTAAIPSLAQTPDAVVSEEENPEAAAATLTKSQKRNQRNRVKRAEKKALLSQLTQAMPVDPSAEDRDATYAGYLAVFHETDALATMQSADVLANFAAVRSKLEGLDRDISAGLKEEHSKLVRLSGKKQTPLEALEEIQKLELKLGSVDDPQVLYLKEHLKSLVAHESVRAHKTRCNELQAKVEERLKANQKLFTHSEDMEKRKKALERIKVLKQFHDVNFQLPENPVVKRETMEIARDAAQIIFPANQRKFEQIFCVVLDREQVDRRGMKVTRTVNIMGLDVDVDQAVRFLVEADWEGKRRAAIEDRLRGSIIGRNGSEIRKLEEQFKCFLVLGETDLQVFGTSEAFNQIVQHVSTLKATQVEAQATEIRCHPGVARYLQNSQIARLRSIATEASVNLRVNYESPEDGMGRLVLRGKPDGVAKAVAAMTPIVEGLVAEELPTSETVVGRLFSGNSQEGNNSPNERNSYTGELNALREMSQLQITRGNMKDGNIFVLIVGTSANVEKYRSKVVDLLSRASHVPLVVKIHREQGRALTDEIRAMIEHETGSSVRIMGRGQNDEISVELLGDETQKESGKTMLEQVLEREASMSTVSFTLDEMVNELLKNRAAKLKEFQDAYGINISIDREKKCAKLVGSKAAILDVTKSLELIQTALQDKLANMTTEVISLESNKIARLIGRGGTTIKSIRLTSQVDRIDVDDKDASVTIQGTPAAVEIARGMINDLFQAPATPASTQSPTADRPAARSRPHPKLPPPPVISDSTSFPSLADAAVTSRRPK